MGTDIKTVKQVNEEAKLCFIFTKPNRLDRLMYRLHGIDWKSDDFD